MMCDEGSLQAYLDGELAADTRREVEAHLAACGQCQAELRALEHRSEFTWTGLAVLAPRAEESVDASRALVMLRRRLALERSSRWERITRSITSMRESLGSRQLWLKPQIRLATAGLIVLVALVAIFSVAPARQAMAQFLGMFRVRKFAVIPVDRTQVANLESLEEYLESALGEPEFLREPGDPEPVIDVATAEALTGYDVREPVDLPEGAALQEVAVAVGPHMRLQLDGQTMETALAMLGIDSVPALPTESVTLEADVPAVVLQEYYVFNPYGSRDAEFTVYQGPSPGVDIPAGIDTTAMGEVLLQVLGMAPRDAQRLAQTIDWTTTLVVPLPARMASAYEVEVNGAPGVLIEENPGSDGYRRGKFLVWEQDGVLYAIGAKNLTAPVLKQIADSLR